MVGTRHAVCPGKKSGDHIRTAIHDFEGDQTYSESAPISLSTPRSIRSPEDYDALVLPGGALPNTSPQPRVIEIVRHFSKTTNHAAVCHAAQILAAADVVRGKKCSAYPAVGPTSPGRRHYVNLAMTEAVVDGNLVTAPAWPAHPAWLAKFLTVLAQD